MMMSKRTFLRAGSRRLRLESSGQSAVEFALLLPVLLLVVTGITTFGIAMNNYIELTEATSVGARQFAISRAQGGDPCSTVAATIASAAPMLKNAGNSSSMAYTFTVGGKSYTSSTCNNATLAVGQPVTVNVTYPCVLKVYGKNLMPTCVLTAQTTEVLQ